MTAPRHSGDVHERIRRREQTAQLWIEGATQTQIAERLGVSVTTVGRDLKQVLDIWRKILRRDLETAKSCELAKINRLEATAWEAWSRSIRDEETTRITVDGEKKKIEKTTHNQTGDAKYLDQIEWCINKRCEILALSGRGTDSGGGDLIINVPRERLEKRSDALFHQELERRGIART